MKQNGKRGPGRSRAPRHVFIIGSKGIPAAYGGFETFVEKLTEYRVSEDIRYHVACRGEEARTFRHNGAECFVVPVRSKRSYAAVLYDLAALRHVLAFLRTHPELERPVVYILACRIGPFLRFYASRIRALGGRVFVNPDGHEWKRAKWSAPVRAYWKLSERLMVKQADLLVCDSKNIEAYIRRDYKAYRPETTYIAYGSETRPSKLADEDPGYRSWLAGLGTARGGYYLIVGRFVPENNFETMIREYMRSGTEKKLVIVTTDNRELYEKLGQRLHFKEDERIRFAEPVYDQELLKKIREGAFAYLHGHSVGGTNPSLLEALGLTKLNLLYEVGFNREVAEDAALYWSLDEGDLAALIDRCDRMDQEEIERFGKAAADRVRKCFSWEKIVGSYEELFLSE